MVLQETRFVTEARPVREEALVRPRHGGGSRASGRHGVLGLCRGGAPPLSGIKASPSPSPRTRALPPRAHSSLTHAPPDAKILVSFDTLCRRCHCRSFPVTSNVRRAIGVVLHYHRMGSIVKWGQVDSFYFRIIPPSEKLNNCDIRCIGFKEKYKFQNV